MDDMQYIDEQYSSYEVLNEKYNGEKNNFALLIDGSALLTTKYYGNLSDEIKAEKDPEVQKLYYDTLLKSPDGRYTNAVFPMLMDIMRMIREQRPAYIVVAFDRSRNTFRKEIYNDYKAQRTPKPEPLGQQFQTMAEILRRIGIKVYDSKNYEADDIIGSIAEHIKGEVPCALLTKDHDYLQLIDTTIDQSYNNEPVVCWMMQTSEARALRLNELYGEQEGAPFGVYEYDEQICLSEEGVYPNQIADKKGLSGDTADNIPGVKGIGEKASIALLQSYQTIEAIYTDIDEKGDNIVNFWKNNLNISRANAIYKALTATYDFKHIDGTIEQVNARDIALLSKQLATIVRTINPNFKKETILTNININEYQNIMKEYGFLDELNRIEEARDNALQDNPIMAMYSDEPDF